MTKFKVGNRVKYVGGMPMLKGYSGTVVEADPLRVDFGDDIWGCVENECEATTSEQVDHPAHYTWLGGIEVIDITEQLSFTLGNVIKYVLRADHKGKPIEDLEKAQWYLAREIKRRKKGEN